MPLVASSSSTSARLRRASASRVVVGAVVSVVPVVAVVADCADAEPPSSAPAATARPRRGARRDARGRRAASRLLAPELAGSCRSPSSASASSGIELGDRARTPRGPPRRRSRARRPRPRARRRRRRRVRRDLERRSARRADAVSVCCAQSARMPTPRRRSATSGMPGALQAFLERVVGRLDRAVDGVAHVDRPLDLVARAAVVPARGRRCSASISSPIDLELTLPGADGVADVVGPPLGRTVSPVVVAAAVGAPTTEHEHEDDQRRRGRAETRPSCARTRSARQLVDDADEELPEALDRRDAHALVGRMRELDLRPEREHVERPRRPCRRSRRTRARRARR